MDDEQGPPSTAADALELVRGALAGSAGPAELLAALAVLRRLRAELASWEPELITAAREQGVSWAGLAPALGVTSRQAAERRYLRLRPSGDTQQTGEERVEAERARRAGDRAVTGWARQNPGSLRRLAGQVSAVEGLTHPAQQQMEIVGRALADDDPAMLLGPLADAHEHLEATHAGLAEQIRSLTAHTERLRRAAHDERSAPS